MINIYVTEKLQDVLNEKAIKEYASAYNGESVGLDLYSVSDDIKVFPDTRCGAMINSGLKVKIPHGYVGLIKERGSITKTSLKSRAGVIDPGFTGEIFVNLVNVGSKEEIIFKGNKLPVQLVVVKCDYGFIQVSESEYLNITTQSARQSGQVGSSD